MEIITYDIRGGHGGPSVVAITAEGSAVIELRRGLSHRRETVYSATVGDGIYRVRTAGYEAEPPASHYIISGRHRVHIPMEDVEDVIAAWRALATDRAKSDYCRRKYLHYRDLGRV